MNKIHEWVNTGLIALVVILVLVGGQSVSVGGSTADFFNADGGFQVDGTTVIDGSGNVDAPITTTSATVGASGTAVARVNTGTCYIKPRATTIVASSTAIVDCQGTAAVGAPWGSGGTQSALTGVADGDLVFVQLATTTAEGGTAAAQNRGIVIVGATASSTQGYIQLLIANNTGGTFTWPTSGTASGTASYIVTDI